MGEWEEIKIGEIAHVQTGPFGSQLHAHDYVPTGIPVIMPTNIGDNLSLTDNELKKITELDRDRLKKYSLQEGDIVYSRRGDVEKCLLVNKEQEGWLCGTGCLFVRIGNSADVVPLFVGYQLSTPSYRKWIASQAVGSTMPNLNTGILSSVTLKIPTLSTQTRIARTLSLLDAKIDLLRRQNATLEALGAAVFREWFVEGEWLMESIGDVLTIVGGGTPSTKQEEYWNGDIAWTTPKDLSSNQGVYLNNTIRTISDKGLSRVSSGLLPEGTLLMSSRAPVGYLAITGIPMAINQGYIAILRGSKLPLQFVYFWLKANMVYIKNSSNGSVFQEISKRVFRSLDIEVPSNEYLERFTKYAESLFQKIRVNQEQIDHIQSLRDLLLPKLMSGQVRVRADD